MKLLVVLIMMLLMPGCFKPKGQGHNRATEELPAPEIDSELEELNRRATVNPADLEVLSGKYGVDRATGKIYFNGKELINADLKTFIILSPRYAKDQNQVYLDRVRVGGRLCGDV